MCFLKLSEVIICYIKTLGTNVLLSISLLRFFLKVGNTPGKIQGRKFVFKKMDSLLFSPCFCLLS